MIDINSCVVKKAAISLMKENSQIVYIAILVVILLAASVSVLQEVLKTQKLEKALSRLQDKLAKGDGTAAEHYELGSVYLDKKLFTQATTQLQKAIKLRELEGADLAAVHNALGYSYFAQEQYDNAIRQYKDALKLYPDYVTVLNNIGHAYEKKSLMTKAIEAYDQALALEPNNETSKRRAESLKKRVPV
jgi:tetratricopeptide (TPR) repeat protein